MSFTSTKWADVRQTPEGQFIRAQADHPDQPSIDMAAALHELIGTPAGRQFVWELLIDTGVFGTVFNGDPLAMAFKEGRRHIGLTVHGLLDHHQIYLMRCEADMRAQAYASLAPPDDDEL